MDQGIAAVLGATVGVLGAMGASAMTYLGVKQQARIAAETEHEKAIWTERIAIYATFIDEVENASHLLTGGRGEIEKLRNALGHQQRGPDGGDIVGDAEGILSRNKEASIAIRAVFKCAARIRVLGPQSLVGVSTDVALELNEQLMVLCPEGCKRCSWATKILINGSMR